ncbi:60S ribosomal protein L7a [Striga asiatica]|uniref:60S ribosomal protein L7a n=1 Tax=Striga asiatica TaxID=4170 RepID=A0A5A7PFN4_STRAF|nr:60S ribosomal protein L7a [Striga asiatica]
MPDEDFVEVKFRLHDGSDMGPFRYSPTSTVAILKERVVSEWPKDQRIAPRSAGDVKLISAGKVLENNRTLAQCKMPFDELPNGVVTMHAVVQPIYVKAKTGVQKCLITRHSSSKLYLCSFTISLCVSSIFRISVAEKKVDEVPQKNLCSCSILLDSEHLPKVAIHPVWDDPIFIKSDTFRRCSSPVQVYKRKSQSLLDLGGISYCNSLGFHSRISELAAEMAPKKGAKPVAKKKVEKVVNPLFEKRPKQFGIGGALPPKKDLHRFVKWPQVVRIQRKKMILKQRLKVPPSIHQFSKTLDKNLVPFPFSNTATSLFKMLLKYRPEDKAQKKERLLKRAQAEAEGKAPELKKPIVVKYGLNHVTYLIEQNKAQLVVIAHDVDPIELVVWLPALCRKMEIPYCIVKGKARLGTIVHKKTASVLCLTSVKNEDKLEFSKILEAIKANFNDKYDEIRKKWGGGVMGSKSQAKTKAKERLLAKEAAQRMT